jgi:hypothetical protein
MRYLLFNPQSSSQCPMKSKTHCDKVRSFALPAHSPATDVTEMLEMLLALDRSVVEVSMQLYRVDRSERRKMRSQNRRLHAAVRHQFPRFLKISRH